jgi:hypothetical protein
MASRWLETGEQGSLHQTSKLRCVPGRLRGRCIHRLIPLANSSRPKEFQLEEHYSYLSATTGSTRMARLDGR